MSKEKKIISDDSEIKTDQEFEITLSGNETFLKINGKECNINNYNQALISDKSKRNKATSLDSQVNQFPLHRLSEISDDLDDDKVEVR